VDAKTRLSVYYGLRGAERIPGGFESFTKAGTFGNIITEPLRKKKRFA
jgi:hypothetical protein